MLERLAGEAVVPRPVREQQSGEDGIVLWDGLVPGVYRCYLPDLRVRKPGFIAIDPPHETPEIEWTAAGTMVENSVSSWLSGEFEIRRGSASR